MDHQAKPGKAATPAPRSDHWLQLQNEYTLKRTDGWDFYAMGANPNWTLAIREDSFVRFESGALTEEYASGIEGRQPADYKGIMYLIKNEETVCNIQIVPDSCTNSIGEILPYSVNIRLENQNGTIHNFEGCGLYLNDPTLNDIWALKSWSRFPEAQKIPGNPNIQINLGTNRVYGNLGCGDIQGFISPKGHKIKIYGLELVERDKACKSAFANELFESLNYKEQNIRREGLDLILSNEADTLVFRKVD